jgi:anti-sigma B factor antagonist
MNMTVTKFSDGAVRLSLSGNLDISAAEDLALPMAALAGGGGGVVVDMTQLNCIATIGIRQLMLAARALGRRRGQLLLLRPNAPITSALKTARVDGLLPIARSEDEARAMLNSAAPRARQTRDASLIRSAGPLSIQERQSK